MTQYGSSLFPFRFHRLEPGAIVAVSSTGDHVFLSDTELHALVQDRSQLPTDTLMDLRAKFFVGNPESPGVVRLIASRLAAKRETVLSGPSLHIVVPTLQCAHSCRYCQVSRSLDDAGASMSVEQIDHVCDSVFESPSRTLTIEFQGGDPLLRFDLVCRAILRIAARNLHERRALRFVVASTLHQLTDDMCAFLREHHVMLSTSLDGPPAIHNANRLLPTHDSYERTIAGVQLARRHLGDDSVSALMTTTRHSLAHPEAIVDEYVAQGFTELFIRPLSPYGFAKRNARLLGHTSDDFQRFYKRAFDRILHWNRQGVRLREVAAAIALNKILSPFDGGYVDLQSPTGSALAVLVYNYDGFIYPSDEARMLAETGDTSLRLGRIGESLQALLATPLAAALVRESLVPYVPGCQECAFNTYCGPDPIQAYSEFGSMRIPVQWTEHCQRQTWLFEFLFECLKRDDPWIMDLAYEWAQPNGVPVDA